MIIKEVPRGSTTAVALAVAAALLLLAPATLAAIPGPGPGPIQNAWTKKDPPSGPYMRSGHAMAFDPDSQRTLLFGGCLKPGGIGSPCGTGGFGDETWSYDGAANRWNNRKPTTGPGARTGHSMVYDTQSRKFVMFGGKDYGGALADVWSYDHGANKWTMLAPATGPSARFGQVMTYDSGSDRVVLYGGQTRSAYEDGETWTFNADSPAGQGTWTFMTPSCSPCPPASKLGALAYDSGSDRVVMFGGCSGNSCGSLQGGTWAYNMDSPAGKGTWSSMVPTCSGSCPTARANHAMAYDSARDVVVLLGGSSTGGFSDETFEYGLDSPAGKGTWTKKSPAAKPTALFGHALAFDRIRAKTVLFGGDTVSGLLDYTQTYDGTTWWNTAPPIGPIYRWDHAMAFDTANSRTLMFGGWSGQGLYPADMWTYSHSSNLWTRLRPTQVPGLRADHAMAFDSSSRVAVLFGGTSANDGSSMADTWVWDGSTWFSRTPSCSPCPTGRTSHVMVYDGPRDRVLMFGGVTASGTTTNELWAYNADSPAGKGTWTKLSPSGTAPPGLRDASGAVSISGSLLVHGGLSAAGFEERSWMFDGVSWSEKGTGAHPGKRSEAAMTFDSSKSLYFLYGGAYYQTNFQDLWQCSATGVWGSVSPSGSPGYRYNHAMVYDTAAGVTVLFGGGHQVGADETWSYKA